MVKYKYTIQIQLDNNERKEVEYTSSYILNENWESVYSYFAKQFGCFYIICWDYEPIEVTVKKRKRKNDPQLSLF